MRHDFSNILSEIYPVNDYIIHLLDSSDVAVIIKHTNTSFPCFPDIKGSKDSMFFRRFFNWRYGFSRNGDSLRHKKAA